MNKRYDAKKEDWSERLELEFQAREAAARKAIMSEIDARLRNERITHETDLDLLKEETVLELEAEMEERLAEFRSKKEEEVATQLERQLDKREEIMRNKALIEVRKREANIRAEIEAQLGVKRAEIRDRLSSLTKQMDDFKIMAEQKMRETIEGKVQSEIDADEARLAQQQDEFDNLKSQDNRAEKRQSWLQAISGQATQSSEQMETDPSAMGARPGLLGSSAGRPMRGALAQAAAQHTPSMGLAGMRAPQSAAKSLSGSTPLVKPVKAPVGGPVIPESALPKPIAPKMVRQPIQPVVPDTDSEPPVAEGTIAPSVVKMPSLTPPSLTPKVEEVQPEPVTVKAPVVTAPKLDISGISPVLETEEEPEMVEIPEPEIESMDDLLEEDLEEIEDLDVVEVEPQVQEIEPQPVTTTLTPIKKLIVKEVEKPLEAEPEVTTPEVEEVQSAPEVVVPVVEDVQVTTEVVIPEIEDVQAEPENLPVLKPVKLTKLQPVKRGGPSSSAPGQKPTVKLQPKVATLTPIKTLKPVTEVDEQTDE